MEATSGVTLEGTASTSACAVLATFLPSLEVLAYHLGRNRFAVAPIRSFKHCRGRIKVDGQMFILFGGAWGASNNNNNNNNT